MPTPAMSRPSLLRNRARAVELVYRALLRDRAGDVEGCAILTGLTEPEVLSAFDDMLNLGMAALVPYTGTTEHGYNTSVGAGDDTAVSVFLLGWWRPRWH